MYDVNTNDVKQIYLDIPDYVEEHIPWLKD